jgi:transcription elongation factor GreA
MIQEMREKLGKEIEDLTRELTVTLPQAIATAVAMGDLRENSEYKAALERQQLVQARLGQLHHRLEQIAQLANTEAPRDRVGLGSRVLVEDVKNGDQETYTVVFAEMMDIDAGHISLASPLGQALKDRKAGEEVVLKLPTMVRKLRVVRVVTIHEQDGNHGIPA